ncbi:MAG: von Willebrand factor type A domain-containing protein, partial [Gemmatimonadales bacterium]
MRSPSVFTRRVPGLSAFLLLIVTTTGAAPVIQLPTTGRVEGHVRARGGAAIAHAQVFVAGSALSALTDSTGRYLLATVPVGSVTLRATFIGYKPAEARVTVRAGRPAIQDFMLDPNPMPAEELTVNAAASPGALNSAAQGYAHRDSKAERQWKNYSRGEIDEPWRLQREPGNTEAYARIEENRFLAAYSNPLSTFSIDVDAASYTNVRRFLNGGSLPPADAVRLEELVNYFPYRYPDRTGEHPFAVTTETGPCPWAAEHRLVRIGLQAKRLATRDLPPSNLVFLLDVSGSMQSPDKLPLVKQAFRALVQELRPEDRVAIVVYAGAAGLVLPSTSGADKVTILEAIERLEAGGSTAGGAGLRLAYDVAKQNYLPEGNNRLILASDGDFNVGVSSDAEMIRLVETRREEGTFLTVLGFGTGNLKDTKMEQMADKGNGHYAYIDT